MQSDTHQILLRGEETGDYPEGNADNRVIQCLKDEQERKTAAYRATGTKQAACYCPAPEVAATEPVRSKKKIWLWISGVAAVLVVGFFAIKPMFDYESSPNYNGAPMEQMRGGDEVFSPAPADSTDNDTIKYNIEKKVNPDE
mgnify:CR=1 FL=1